MTYNEWRDELNSNLLCVSDAERRRVLDYYAEAYADRREAGFSEREITDGFGAPYDAAQRILNEKVEETEQIHEQNQPENKSEPASKPPAKVKSGRGWGFAIACIILCIPIFALVVTMAAITFAFCITPVAIIGGGAVAMGSSVVLMIGGDVTYGLYNLGGGLITLGIGIILFPLLYSLASLMWRLFRKLFNAFGKKESAV